MNVIIDNPNNPTHSENFVPDINDFGRSLGQYVIIDQPNEPADLESVVPDTNDVGYSWRQYVIIDQPNEPNYFERFVPGTNGTVWSWRCRAKFSSIEVAKSTLDRLKTIGYKQAEIINDPNDNA